MFTRLSSQLKHCSCLFSSRYYSVWKRSHWDSILQYNKETHIQQLDQYAHPLTYLMTSQTYMFGDIPELERRVLAQDKIIAHLKMENQDLTSQYRNIQTSLDILRKSQAIIRQNVKNSLL